MTIKRHLGPFYAFLVIVIAIPSLRSIVWRFYVISASFMRHRETLGKLFQLSANAATLATILNTVIHQSLIQDFHFVFFSQIDYCIHKNNITGL